MAAEFKISRLKYTWQGEWQAGTVYNPDDVVVVSGKVYTCLVRHTASLIFYTDLLFQNNDVPPAPEPKWELMADGVEFVGNWTPTTEYFIGNIAKLGGISYICLVGHTSVGSETNFENDLNAGYWQVFIDRLDWKNVWTISTFYKVGDLVKYSGKLYICNTKHTSSATPNPGLLDDIAKWTEFVYQDSWKDSWNNSTLYKLNDLVRYGGKIYRCIIQHESTAVVNDGLEDDQEKWEEFLDGIEYRGTWAISTKYKINDIVKYGGYLYQAINNHVVGINDIFDVSNWQIFCPGQEYENQWSSATLYQTGDVVRHGGNVYVSNALNINSEPDYNQGNLNVNWSLLFDGVRVRGEWTSTSTYKAGDIVRRNGQIYSAKRNVTVGSDVDIIGDGSTINSDDWDLVIPGVQWRGIWNTDNTYLIGDLVQWQGGSYKCIVKHISALANRPDTSFGLGVEWEQYSFANEENVLSFIGDIKKFGSVTTERVPVGTSGQALRVTSNNPVWANFNASADVYYVTLDGIDGIGRGTTLNSAWRTLRYALDNCKSYVLNLEALSPAVLAAAVGSQSHMPNLYSLLTSDNGGFQYGDFNCDGDIYSTDAQAALRYSANQFTLLTSVQITRIEQLIAAINANQDLYKNEYVTTGNPDTYPIFKEDISKSTTILVKTGTFEEILPLRIPANTAVVGDELRGTIIRPVENYFTADDITKYGLIIDFISSFIGNIITGVTITSPLGHVAQSAVAPFATSTETAYTTTRLNLIKTGLTLYTPASLDGTNVLSVNTNVLRAARQLGSNLEFIQSEAKAYLAINYPSYSYESSILDSAVSRIVKALVYDLVYTGNYKSIETSRFFYNGSNAAQNKLENMFLLRDNTGLRNCTLVGLEGTLSSLNTYQTRRPTAGAFASLDPGWGPLDSNVWVGNRSPYVQNVTTFGTACVGLKIDGALHTGGNKTIVCNDFTQILSDGIGVWANADGGTECVSVFTYYNHIGYLCTDGGKIRGTNGNCSYGTFGAVAEGVDLNESPILATVDNRYYDAVVGQTFTDGSNIQKLFFENAGQNYTTASFSVTGAGINASLLGNEFRDGSVFQVRLANLNDSSSPLGTAYSLNINNAQSGDNYAITLAASTDEAPADLRDLRIVINSGTGAGQYGYIADYDNASKIVLVGRETFEPLTVSNTVTGSNTLAVSSTDIHIRPGDRVCFTGTLFGGVVANTEYIVASKAGNVITLTDLALTPVALTTASGSMTMHRLGWDHFQPGLAIETVLDTTTRYFIEPRPVFTTPTRSSTAGTLADNNYWTSAAYNNGVWVAVNEGPSNNGEYINRSTDGTTWTQIPLPSGGWTAVIYANGKFVAVAKDGKAATSTNGLSWSAGTIPNAEYRALAYGDGYYIAVASGGNQAARSVDGVTWSAVTLPEGADWTSIAYGKGVFVAVSQGDSSSANIAYSTNAGTSWTLSSLPGGSKSVVFGNNRFVAVAGGFSGANDTFISFDGITWQAGSIDAANWSSVTYGQGMFVAVAAFESFAAYSINGLEWRYIDLDDAINWSAIVFGKDATTGKFIVLPRDSNVTSELRIGTRAEARVSLVNNKISQILMFEPGSGYTSIPTLDIIDPNNTANASAIVRIADGVLGNPTIVNDGEGWLTTSTIVTITGNGFMDQYQVGNELVVSGATRIPGPGDNLIINGIDDYVYKVLTAVVLNGGPGNYQLKLTIAKSLQSNESPDHLTGVTIRQKYSQVRLTGHDFLEIGLGNFQQTNYPNTLFPIGTIIAPENEIKEAGGGRCFYTSTDQDGNFRVGELFAVEQATGTVTINAEFFELEGLEELSLGGVSIGGSGVVIREFSTDPLFTADSNNVVPTQKAIKEYIARRVSGGGSDAFTGQFTAGIIRVGPNVITTTTLERINIPVKVKFKAPVAGKMLAMSYFVNTNNEDTGEENIDQ